MGEAGMRMFFFALLVSALNLLPATHADQSSVWGKEAVSSWAGKYPSDISGGKASLLGHGEVNKTLQQVLPTFEQKNWIAYDAESTIKQVDHFLVIEKCMPHNCPSAFATIVIDLNQKRLWVGLFSRDATRTSTRWYGNADDYSVLPEVIRQGFINRHEGFMSQHAH
jgi:hypothetical protein